MYNISVMRIILTENVKGLGQVGEIKEVKNGYAVNFLVPRRLAILATAENIKKAENLRQEREKRVMEEIERMRQVSEKLKDLRLVMETKADEKGHLYVGINPKKVAEALKERGIAVEAELVLVNEPIKKLGVHGALFKYFDIEVPFEVEVVTAGGVRKSIRR